MKRRSFVTVAATASLTGCTELFGSEENSRLDLTVHNARSAPITAQVSVVGPDGTTYADESDQINGGVSRAFEVPVGIEGRHVVTVTGSEWRGQLAWQADACVRYEATLRITPDLVEVAGECVQSR